MTPRELAEKIVSELPDYARDQIPYIESLLSSALEETRKEGTINRPGSHEHRYDTEHCVVCCHEVMSGQMRHAESAWKCVKEAKSAAYEEAAKIAETYLFEIGTASHLCGGGSKIAKRIRQLKDSLSAGEGK